MDDFVMTKYFKATVTVQQTIEVSVAAQTERDARRMAQEAASKMAPGSSAVSVDLALEGESCFSVGTKIRHFLFGAGEILSLVQTTNGLNEFGLSATVRFDSGDTKNIHLPMAKDKLEVVPG